MIGTQPVKGRVERNAFRESSFFVRGPGVPQFGDHRPSCTTSPVERANCRAVARTWAAASEPGGSEGRRWRCSVLDQQAKAGLGQRLQRAFDPAREPRRAGSGSPARPASGAPGHERPRPPRPPPRGCGPPRPDRGRSGSPPVLHRRDERAQKLRAPGRRRATSPGRGAISARVPSRVEEQRRFGWIELWRGGVHPASSAEYVEYSLEAGQSLDGVNIGPDEEMGALGVR